MMTKPANQAAPSVWLVDLDQSADALARLGLKVGALVVADPIAAGSREIQMLRDHGVEVEIVPGAIQVTATGWYVVRAVAMVLHRA